eukprot:2509538-Pyramimonas_sp.AAC.1
MGPSRLQLGALGVCAAAGGHLLEPSWRRPVRLGQRGGRGGGEHRDSALKEILQASGAAASSGGGGRDQLERGLPLPRVEASLLEVQGGSEHPESAEVRSDGAFVGSVRDVLPQVQGWEVRDPRVGGVTEGQGSLEVDLGIPSAHGGGQVCEEAGGVPSLPRDDQGHGRR